MTKRQGACK